MYRGFIYINKMKAIRIIILIVLIASIVVIHPNCDIGVLLNCYKSKWHKKCSQSNVYKKIQELIQGTTEAIDKANALTCLQEANCVAHKDGK